jgi:hypothetical protein
MLGMSIRTASETNEHQATVVVRKSVYPPEVHDARGYNVQPKTLIQY